MNIIVQSNIVLLDRMIALTNLTLHYYTIH